MPGELIVLGCGDSMGTPRIGNAWGKCDPHEPKNLRTRPSVCLRSQTTTIVVDTGPDFKQQLNRENITDIDAVIYTHAHSDHVNGLDDLKPFFDRTRHRMPVYLRPETLDDLRYRFHYIFQQTSPLYPSIVEPVIWQDEDFLSLKRIGDIAFMPFLQDHGYLQTIGLRWGNVGYSTDLVSLDEAGIQALSGIDTWIVDGANLYFSDPVVHMNLEKIQAFNQRIGAERIYLTHMKNDLDYHTLCNELPAGIQPAYDGLRLNVKTA